MSQLLKNLKISKSIDEINVRILKLPNSSSHRILQSLNSNQNLSFIFKPSLGHSFSVYSRDDSLREYFRISFPIQYCTIDSSTDIRHYIDHIDTIPQQNPYLIFLLGQGKSCIGYFDADHEMTDWREISRIIQCKNIIKLKYPKKSPVFMTNENLTRFYSETIHKIQKWSYLMRRKADQGMLQFDIDRMNIGWMADDRIWHHFWDQHQWIMDRENERQSVMPFDPMTHCGVFRIGDYAMGYPKKTDLLRFSHQLREFYCYIDYDTVNDRHFPKEIKELMEDEELCWDPLAADETEKRNSRGKRKMNRVKESEGDGNKKGLTTKEQIKMKKEMKKAKSIEMKTRKQVMPRYVQESQKIDDLERLLGAVTGEDASNRARV